MFDQTFVDGAGKTNKGWTVTVSFLAEFVAMGVLILTPLIWTEVLPKARSVNSLSAPALPPAPPPSAPAHEVTQTRILPRAFNRQVLEAPYEIPRQVMVLSEDTAPLLTGPVNEVSIPGAAAAGTTATFSNAIAVAVPPSSPVPPKPDVKPRQETPLLVGGNVQSAKLIKHPAPTYPDIAKSARIQGTVVLQAIIGKDGAVRDLKVVSAGSPLLIRSATDAVKQWVYRPTLLNQEPVEVVTEITVVFTLQ